MKTQTIRITAFLLFMMSVGSVSAQARTEREFMHLQNLRERKLAEAEISRAEMPKPHRIDQVEKQSKDASPCNRK